MSLDLGMGEKPRGVAGARRMVERLRRFVEIVEDGKGIRFRYRPPAGDLPAEDIQDGFGKTLAHAEGRDEYYLRWLLNAVPRASWEEAYGRSPDDLVKAALQTRRWGWWMLHFWSEEQARRPEPRWEDGLLGTVFAPGFAPDLGFLRKVERGKFERVFADALLRNGWKGDIRQDMCEALHERDDGLSWALTRCILDYHAKRAELAGSGRLCLLEALCEFGHPDLAEEATALLKELVAEKGARGLESSVKEFETRYARRHRDWKKRGGVVSPSDREPILSRDVVPTSQPARPAKVKSVVPVVAPPSDSEWPEDPRAPAPPEAEKFLHDLIKVRSKVHVYNYWDLLLAFLDASIKTGLAPSVESIKLLLGKDSVRRDPWVRSRVALLLGPRAEWVRARYPEWATKSHPPPSCSREEAVRILEGLPDLDPSAGPVPPAPAWKKLSEEMRVAVVLALAEEPTESDVPLLERVLSDPDDELARTIHVATSRFENSGFRRRMIARADRWFVGKRSKGELEIEVRIPATDAEYTAEDAFDRFSTRGTEDPVIQHINLLHVLPYIPLGYWCERFGATPEELVRARKSESGGTFHSMWGLAQERQNAPGWGEALFQAALENPKDSHGPGCVQHLDPDLLAEGIESLLAEKGREHVVQSFCVGLLMRLPSHASERLTRSILKYYREAVGLERQQDVFVFSELCRSGHPAVWPEFRETFELLKRTAPFPMEILLSNFGKHYHLANYEMRHRLHALYPEISTAVGKGRLTNYGP